MKIHYQVLITKKKKEEEINNNNREKKGGHKHGKQTNKAIEKAYKHNK